MKPWRTCANCGGRHQPKCTGGRRPMFHTFCSPECYYAFRHDPATIRWRHGMRLARKAVGQYFTLKRGSVVHHHDKNDRNNDPRNLAVFSSNAGHVAFHHGNPSALPLWDGRNLTVEQLALTGRRAA